MTPPQESAYLHANALVLGAFGLLLRGPSGAGKSALTLQLIADWRARGAFAALVGDDRVALEARHGRLIARPHPSIRGIIEARGLGLMRVAYEPACVLRAVVDLLAAGEPPKRYPDEEEAMSRLSGVTLPRMFENAASVGVAARIAAYIQNVATN
ncbi:HPr kinase/phosphatase C-terminal domain-containing protein [Methylocystis sp. L43]|jgi:HPr kinase/phosphorylase|uniref:HPr kinase/phosphorylase n=1 Tax=unclassified Methylocystis TaxID=2625913 RepID=UPI0018C29CE3|nr:MULTISPECIES: HPr kinase/phosphatase C-terminal domain-containing protein [unclassified Methylocystis]MBG0796144.1 HPr kinase/phosphatase C-terminal domain-containing protein [Methylocystis sp. L43]MBG0804067.1 HPr kinase/phosphatase C-terminal domain-containing protein [Methylocystis sp. H15]